MKLIRILKTSAICLLFLLNTDVFAADPQALPINFRPIADTGGFTVFSADTLEKNQLALEISADLLEPAGYNGKGLDQKTVSYKLGYGLLDFIQLGVEVPYTWWQVDSVPYKSKGLDDINLGVKVRLLEESEKLPSIGIVGFISLTTGDKSKGIGTKRSDGGVKLIASKNLISSLNASINIGYTGVGRTSDIPLRNEFTYGVGIDYGIYKGLNAIAEIAGSTNRYINQKSNPLEFFGGLRFSYYDIFYSTFGFRKGFNNASPDWGILGSISFKWPKVKNIKDAKPLN